MKKNVKRLLLCLVITLFAVSTLVLVACNGKRLLDVQLDENYTLYEGESIENVRSYLIVTYTSAKGNSRVVSDYELSGTLKKGNSKVKVSYNKLSKTVTVKVAESKATKGLEYTKNGNEYFVAGIGSAVEADIYIPTTYQGKPVTVIAEEAFSNCKTIKSVFIGGNVARINDSAFYNCTNLTNITFGASVKIIGEDAFTNCEKLQNVYYTGDVSAWCSIQHTRLWGHPLYNAENLYFKGELVTEVVIPDTLKEINAYSFGEYGKLQSVTIGSGVEKIGEGAFACENITTLNYTGDIVSWCNIEFENWASNPLWAAHDFHLNGTKVTDLVIPDSVTKLNDFVFENASFNSVKLSSGLTSIGNNAFESNINLTNITFSNGLKSIGDYAFSYCNRLTSVVIPDSVTTVGDLAFYNCSSMVSATVGDNVQTIGSNAFDGCTQLSTFTLGKSVTSIGGDSFKNCINLHKVYYNGTLTTWCNIDFGNVWASPLYNEADLYIGNQLLTNLVVPNDVTKLEYCVFYNCKSIKSVTIPTSVKKIDSFAFYGCNVSSITYLGTKAQWNLIDCEFGINYWDNSIKYIICSDGTITL